VHKDVAEVVADVVARTAGVPRERLKADSRLVDFGIDSLQALEVVIQLEWIFGIDIFDRDLPALNSLEDLSTYIELRLPAR
jgi:acyl carrier protein